MKRAATVKVTAARAPEIEAVCWKIAMRLKTFGYAEISAEASISMDAATKFVREWVSNGKCVLHRNGTATGRKQFRVAVALQRAADPALAPMRRIWTSMRKLKTFSPTDLSAHSTVDATAVTPASAAAYCQSLLWAGYLVVKRTAIPGQREAIYRLVRDTGPLAPRARRVRAVFDDNLGELVRVEGQAT